MSTTIPVADSPVAEQALPWLALALTPGLGPTRVRRLVERFGTMTAVFHASLTELEATGLLAVSAQAIGTGKSFQLAQEEIEKVKAAGAQIVTLDDSRYPLRLKEIYDPPVLTLCARRCRHPGPTGDCRRRHQAPDALRFGYGGAPGD